MRVDLFFLTITPFITLGLSATVLHRPLKQTPSPLPSHLHGPTTFYRAVAGDQVALALDIYPIGKSPTAHKNTSGDFSQIGGLYVFADRERAATYGSCFARLHPTYSKWYLVGLSYVPKENLKVKTFHLADREWKLFIRNNYTHKRPQHKFDIVEGAYSYGADGTDQVEVWIDPVTGELVWQGAFIGHDALQALTVEELSLHNAMDNLKPNPSKQFFSSDSWPGAEQHPLEDPHVERLIASECMQTAPTTGIAIS